MDRFTRVFWLGVYGLKVWKRFGVGWSSRLDMLRTHVGMIFH